MDKENNRVLLVQNAVRKKEEISACIFTYS